MNKIYITCMKYVNQRGFNKECFNHPHARVMDELSKRALILAREIFDEEVTKMINPERTGVVIASNTGPYGALSEHADILLTSGFKGINPSKFPNTMLSTVLSRVTKELHLKGPSTAMYIDSEESKALEYAVIQIEKGRCDIMAALVVGENRDGFGILLQSEKSLLESNLKARFYINSLN